MGAVGKRKFSLTWYLLLVCLLSWPFQILAIYLQSGLFGRYALNSLSMIMVAVATFIYGTFICKDGFKRAGWTWGKPVHYMAILGLVLFIWVLPTIIDLFRGSIQLPLGLQTWQIVAIPVFLIVTIIPGFGEEFGWRGYMLPHLSDQHSIRMAIFIQAVIWWLWHTPILMENFYYIGMSTALIGGAKITVIKTMLLYLLISGLPAIAHGILFAYIWTRCGLMVAVVYHALINGVRDSLSITIGHGPVAGIWINVAFILIGALLLWKGDWSKLKALSNKTVSD